MESTGSSTRALFSMLDGMPSHVLIVAGLALTLIAPLFPSFKLAEVASARVASEQAQALIELDLEDMRREHEKQRKDEEERSRADQSRNLGSFGTLSTEEFQRQQEEQRKRQEEQLKREADRKKALDDKQEELRKKYDTIELRRNLLSAQSSAAGMRWHLVIEWLGRLMLLVGLLVLTIQGDGLRQKILLIILLVVMFSALSGVNLNFLAQGGMGGSSTEIESPAPRPLPPNR